MSWNGRMPFDRQGSYANFKYYSNMYYGGSNNFSDPGLVQGDPLFVNGPYFDPTNGGQYATALAPWLLGSGLKLLSNSPARGKGIDPSMLPGLPAALISDLRKYIYRDIEGKVRPGSGCDLGAYHQ